MKCDKCKENMDETDQFWDTMKFLKLIVRIKELTNDLSKDDADYIRVYLEQCEGDR